MYLDAVHRYFSDLRIPYCVACDIINSRARARAVRSGTTTATTGVRVLPEASVARVPLGAAAAALLLLGARVPVTAWPRRARVCLVLVALEQSSDRGPASFFFAVQ